ncbi:MAG: hypothetical protein FIA91_00580 [Geobacter sp.]|nr:hypothetical protein [Geobacter sp.]
MMLLPVLAVTAGMGVYCLRLARKYRRIEADMQCIYEGVVHKIDMIIFDRNDWFLRKVRLHTSSYPYVVEVLISEVNTL